MILFQMLFAFIVVYFTAFVFEAPKKLHKYIAILGAFGWLSYLILIENYNYIAATYFSSFIIAIFSHLFARKFKVPVTVFFIPSFFPLVPGTQMYQAVYSYITGDSALGNVYFLETLLKAGMIALAILTVDSLFRIYYKNIKSKSKLKKS